MGLSVAESRSAPLAEVDAHEVPSRGTETRLGMVRLVVDSGAAEGIAVTDIDLAAAASFEPLVNEIEDRLRAGNSSMPVVAVREVVENLVHAHCRDAVVLLCDRATVVIVADHGPGVEEPQKALLPGYGAATPSLRQFIRGVGLGLPRAYDAMQTVGGALRLDGNLGGGTVVTLSLHGEIERSPSLSRAVAAQPPDEPAAAPRLTSRQKQILMLLADGGSAGPSAVARELKIGLSTAFRDLSDLEGLGLAEPLGKGKRALTEQATADLMDLLKAPD